MQSDILSLIMLFAAMSCLPSKQLFDGGRKGRILILIKQKKQKLLQKRLAESLQLWDFYLLTITKQGFKEHNIM